MHCLANGIDHCAENPCHEGVTCQSKPGGYSCGPCPPGMQGNGSYCQGKVYFNPWQNTL